MVENQMGSLRCLRRKHAPRQLVTFPLDSASAILQAAKETFLLWLLPVMAIANHI
jgi:hypothetical protein